MALFFDAAHRLNINNLFFRWDADQVLGEPNVYPDYGDIKGAWAHMSPNDCSNERIEV